MRRPVLLLPHSSIIQFPCAPLRKSDSCHAFPQTSIPPHCMRGNLPRMQYHSRSKLEPTSLCRSFPPALPLFQNICPRGLVSVMCFKPSSSSTSITLNRPSPSKTQPYARLCSIEPLRCKGHPVWQAEIFATLIPPSRPSKKKKNLCRSRPRPPSSHAALQWVSTLPSFETRSGTCTCRPSPRTCGAGRAGARATRATRARRSSRATSCALPPSRRRCKSSCPASRRTPSPCR
ncbi:unnamed protein product [Chondrus crispus]|uniref:Uncharacterized protein n=1 Tax=Chondrus crispus TaxID=2769 RepID=R7QP65_CHOCR|nr:unnamed protein product [Chondrus crispus]CDF40292.1 unnamed protein product [Chondrus crispus]|eukprot:XP_005710586.1 unnamed protein product [Chondrus crispus]